MSSTMNAKPTIAPANQRNTKEKKEHRLVVAPPSLRPGGIMPPPQSKGGQDGTGAGGEEFTFNSLVSTISSLSPWAEVSARVPHDRVFSPASRRRSRKSFQLAFCVQAGESNHYSDRLRPDSLHSRPRPQKMGRRWARS